MHTLEADTLTYTDTPNPVIAGATLTRPGSPPVYYRYSLTEQGFVSPEADFAALSFLPGRTDYLYREKDGREWTFLRPRGTWGCPSRLLGAWEGNSGDGKACEKHMISAPTPHDTHVDLFRPCVESRLSQRHRIFPDFVPGWMRSFRSIPVSTWHACTKGITYAGRGEISGKCSAAQDRVYTWCYSGCGSWKLGSESCFCVCTYPGQAASYAETLFSVAV